MPRTRLRYNWRQNLSQPRVLAPPISNIDAQNAVNARLAQFPLEQQAREAQLSRAAAAEAQARYKLSKEIETDRQRTAFYNGLQELEQSIPKLGTKEHAEAFAAYAHEFPLARSSSDVAQMLKLHATVNDDQAALTQRMQQSIAAGQAAGLEPEGASFIKGGQVDVRFKGTGAIPSHVAQRYARVQGQIQGYTDESSQQRAANIAAGKANVPYTNAGPLHAAQTEASMLEQQYPALNPNAQDQTETGDIQNTSQPVAPVDAATPSATPDQVVPTETPPPVPSPTPVHLGRYNPETGEFE